MSICRTCLRTQDQTQSLFNNQEIINKIKAITGLQLVKDHNFPFNICTECVENVDKCYNFRNTIIDSEKELKKRLETETPEIIKDEPTNSDDCDEITEEEGSQECDEESYNILDQVNAVLGEQNLKCDDCDKEFSSQEKLKDHRRRSHVKKGICTVCGLGVRQDNLKRHIQNHNALPEQCNVCGKVVKSFASLRGHMLTHKGNVFTCDICGKQFLVKSQYNRHVKTHNDPNFERKECKICGKKVKYMKAHLISHTGERSHICQYCKKAYSSAYALEVHVRKHTNETPFKCEYCSKGFTHKSGLEYHLRTKHIVTK